MKRILTRKNDTTEKFFLLTFKTSKAILKVSVLHVLKWYVTVFSNV